MLIYNDYNVVYSYVITVCIVNFIAWLVLRGVVLKVAFVYGDMPLTGIRKFSYPQATNSLLSFATNNADIFIIAYFSGLAVSGVYGVVKLMALKPLQTFMPVFLRVYTPKIIDGDRPENTFIQLVLSVAVVSAIVYTFIILFSSIILHKFFDIDTDEAAYAFSIFCIYAYLRSVCMTIGVLITKSGNTALGLNYTIFQLLIVASFLSFFNTDIVVISFAFLIYQVLLLVPHWFYMIRGLSNSVGILKYHSAALLPVILPLLCFLLLYGKF